MHGAYGGELGFVVDVWRGFSKIKGMKSKDLGGSLEDLPQEFKAPTQITTWPFVDKWGRWNMVRGEL